MNSWQFYPYGRMRRSHVNPPLKPVGIDAACTIKELACSHSPCVRWRAVREATGAHVMLVHHCGKDEARGARGHSCLRAAVDTEIELFRPEGERVSTVRVTKQRDLQIGELMPFSLKVVALGTNRRGKPITSCVVHHEAEEMAAKPGRAGRKAKASPDDMLR